MKETVLIAGGSGYVGQALCKSFAEGAYKDRYDVIIADIKRPESNENRFYKFDITKRKSVERLVKKIKKSKDRVFHFVNLIGAMFEKQGLTSMENTSYNQICDTINLNVTGALYLAKLMGEYLIPHEKGEDRSLTMVSSINARVGLSIPFYSAAKAAIEGYVKPATLDLGRYGVRVNGASLGTIQTEETLKQQKNFVEREKSAALRRLTTPEGAAKSIRALINDLKCTAGHILVVDCGQSANGSQSLFDQTRRGETPSSGPEKYKKYML